MSCYYQHCIDGKLSHRASKWKSKTSDSGRMNHRAVLLYNLFHSSFNAVSPCGSCTGHGLPFGALQCKFNSSSGKIPSHKRPQWWVFPIPSPIHPLFCRISIPVSSLVLISCFKSPIIQGLLLLCCSEKNVTLHTWPRAGWGAHVLVLILEVMLQA